jgi:hypothetical protein
MLSSERENKAVIVEKAGATKATRPELSTFSIGVIIPQNARHIHDILLLLFPNYNI